jgi:hypothetical protein
MSVSGDHWPVFLYAGCIYDAEDLWKGLFRSIILVSVSHLFHPLGDISEIVVKAYKHIFMSPSLVDRGDKENKATQSGNA